MQTVSAVCRCRSARWGGSFGDDDDNDTLLVRSTKKVGGEGSIGARAEALLVHTYLAMYRYM